MSTVLLVAAIMVAETAGLAAVACAALDYERSRRIADLLVPGAVGLATVCTGLALGWMILFA